ncbi:MAG: bifunctional oligoribonuclease/PAP phosphatase NrnA [Phycisphaerae bacterium]|nr:bifunctional oligoribonuclease/PAP phosphatase NrnA [Phycisphaerae bacterium]
MIIDADFQKAIELINKSKRVLLATHTKPDGDGCGSMVAIREALAGLGKDVKILLLSELPGWYEFLFEQRPEIFSEKTKIESDLIIIVDTATYNQLPEFDKHLKESDKSILVIDHHATSEATRLGAKPRVGDCQLIDSSAGAAGLIVFDLLKYAGWPITKRVADALFVAISTDTGWFQFDNTDSRILKVCAELIDAGVSASRIYHDLYQNFSPQRFRLMVSMLNSLELELDGRFAMQHLTRADFEKAGAKYSDTENLIDECRRMSGIEAAALFVESADGRVKVSLRSRSAIDVCKIAGKFGGGGHKLASGTYLPGSIEDAKKLIIAEMQEQLK